MTQSPKDALPEGLCGEHQHPTQANIALFEACCQGDLNAVLLALNNGASPSYCHSFKDKTAPSCLHALSTAKDSDEEAAQCAKELLQRGAIADSTLISNLNTPLHEAAASGCVHLCRALLDHRASALAVNSFGNTPVHSAIQSASPDIVAMLLQAGADANAQNHRGSTPLHIVCFLAKDLSNVNDRSCFVEIASLLIDVGKIDVDCKDINGYTAVAVASQYGCNDLVRNLATKGNANLTLRTNIDENGRGDRNARESAIFGGHMETADLIDRIEMLRMGLGQQPMQEIVGFEEDLKAVDAGIAAS